TQERARAYRTVCKVLADARTEADLTQRGLSEMLKRPHSYVGKIEGGERRVDVVEFIELARALNVDPVKLFARLVE
ncbi:MAG TPA: helix-turn-helix transcriptional regulator, partial [Steroidobacter sp.]|nr:helix-turn-helix transcriptional regulator [Steroidobacter sp.]